MPTIQVHAAGWHVKRNTCHVPFFREERHYFNVVGVGHLKIDVPEPKAAIKKTIPYFPYRSRKNHLTQTPAAVETTE
jgi:hypothetical protein